MNIQNQHQMIDITDINELLCDLVDIHQNEFTGLAMKRVLQCIFNLSENRNVNLSARIFEKLILAMIGEFDGNTNAASSSDYHRLVSNILICIRTQVSKFPSAEGKSLLELLWSVGVNGDHPLAGQFLVKLFDDFVRELGIERCLQMVPFVKQLLMSKAKKDRQLSYFLLHKLEGIFDTNNVVAEALKCTKKQWSDFIVVVEKLEKEETVPNFYRLFNNNYKLLKSNNDFAPWIYVFYKSSLQSDNISIVGGLLRFILNNVTLSQLTDWNLMEDYLAATNRTQLYTLPNCDSPLSEAQSANDIVLIIAAMVNVSWEWNSVPLCEWLKIIGKSVERHDKALLSETISKETFFKLCSAVKRMKHEKLYQYAICKIRFIFEKKIKELSLEDYFIYLETMYKDRDEYFWEHFALCIKIQHCVNFKTQISYFNPLRLPSLCNFYEADESKYFLSAMIRKIRKLPKAHHGWFRFFMLYGLCSMFETSNEISNFYSTEYGVDVALIEHSKDLNEIQDHLIDKLICTTTDEKNYILRVSMEIFVHTRIKKWSEIEEFQLNPVELLKQGGWQTIRHLAKLLHKCEEQLQDENVLSAFVSLIKEYHWIYSYVQRHLTNEQQHTLALLNKEDNFYEDVWAYCIDKNVCFKKHSSYQLWDYEHEVITQLIGINRELSESYPHYLYNSKEHRLKFYIAETLLILSKIFKYPVDQLWPILFSQNEQFNITCMYELIVANTLTSFDPILERLQLISTLKPNHQISLLSVTSLYVHLNNSKVCLNEFQNMFTLLQNLANNGEIWVSQFSMWIVDELTIMCKNKGVQIPLGVNNTTLERKLLSTSVGPQLKARFLLHEMYSQLNKDIVIHLFYPYIFCMSNFPPRDLCGNGINLMKVDEFREAIKSAINEKYWRSDLMPQNTLVNDADFIIVASFIDDLTSLNGLIRTCKALRVRTLILSDSTSLRPENEDSLNIAEMSSDILNVFLSEKKLRNYNIVATKKAGESADFIKFSFAKKTILLIGHEQHGIPEELTYLLDKTVELPQRDYQYSQNLLIFIYHKQYIANE